MRLFLPSLWALCALWVAFEIGLVLLRRSGKGAAGKDGGSLRLLNAVIYSSVGVGMFLSATRVGAVRLPPPILWSGPVLIAAGLGLRLWAVVTLARFFTVDVAIQADHQLVERGPYRFVRHPAYSGVLMSFTGLAVSSSSWISALVILVPIVSAFLYRIRIEEEALMSAFPSYAAYAARTSRLLPGLY